MLNLSKVKLLSPKLVQSLFLWRVYIWFFLLLNDTGKNSGATSRSSFLASLNPSRWGRSGSSSGAVSSGGASGGSSSNSSPGSHHSPSSDKSAKDSTQRGHHRERAGSAANDSSIGTPVMATVGAHAVMGTSQSSSSNQKEKVKSWIKDQCELESRPAKIVASPLGLSFKSPPPSPPGSKSDHSLKQLMWRVSFS